MEELQQLQNLLFESNFSTKRGFSFNTGWYIRLHQALYDRNSTGIRDLAVLIRGVLRYEAEKLTGTSPGILVPKGEGWPDKFIWQQSGVHILKEMLEGWWITTDRWRPNWLSGADKNSPDQPLYSMEERNHWESVLGDPFLHVMKGINTYRCSGQRDAIRSILMMPEGSTFVVVLPTGSGKSLCAQLPALLSSDVKGVTVVIVPTTALAIDQERAFQEYVDYPTAYYSGSERQEINRAIQERILNGTQRIVFASPESLLKSLRFSVQVAAERGYLRYLVIDEAHMADAWGDEFRPAFQEMSGWRRYLLRKSATKFRTILLSATITEHCLDTLKTLFGAPGPFEVFSAMHLRPEPALWSHKCVNEEQREQCILEAVAHLPRPLILYTTKVEDANHWGNILYEQGYRRFGVVTGKTEVKRRAEIIEQWQSQKIDMVVATSAFGMGVDQKEVRTVIHACIPESVDRYYQEIGRGGRDGRASLSLVIYTETDRQIAEDLNQKKLIGIERGRQRWERMFRHKKWMDGDLVKVPVNVSPSVEDREIDMNNQRNKDWNIRTLTLMSRAGLIEFEWEDIACHKTDEQEDSTPYHIIRILHQEHLSEKVWEQHIQALRLKSQRADRQSLQLMYEVLEGNRCVSDIFQELYQIQVRHGDRPRNGVFVQRACGGCKACRNMMRSPFFQPTESKPVDWRLQDKVSNYLRNRFLHGGRKMILYYDQLHKNGFAGLTIREKHIWHELIRWFQMQGVCHFVGDIDFINFLKGGIRQQKKQIIFVSTLLNTPITRSWPNVPTFIIQPANAELYAPIKRLVSSFHQDKRITILLLPTTTLDTEKPGRLLKQRVDGLLWTEFRKEVGL